MGPICNFLYLIFSKYILQVEIKKHSHWKCHQGSSLTWTVANTPFINYLGVDQTAATPEKDGSSKLRCVVSLCSSDKDVFYHNFPEFGSKRYVAWCEACDIDQKTNKESKICSKHFTKGMIKFINF